MPGAGVGEVSMNSDRVVALAVLWLAAATVAKPVRAQQPAIAQTFLKVGQPAPDFTLLDNHWKKHRLSDYRGKTVVLAFYVLAFTSG
jgi:cytochrome oxidase Cu insertion factor (SCO1/SenC/PrrC family)